jgi:hypothetical protein
MDDRTAAALSRLCEEATHDVAEEVRRVAILTGGLPVWSDMGGVLILKPDGSVLEYDKEEGTVRPASERSHTLALVEAALKHPELRALGPERPPEAHTCPQCSGSGVVMGNVVCGVCMRTGWLLPSKRE